MLAVGVASGGSGAVSKRRSWPDCYWLLRILKYQTRVNVCGNRGHEEQQQEAGRAPGVPPTRGTGDSGRVRAGLRRGSRLVGGPPLRTPINAAARGRTVAL